MSLSRMILTWLWTSVTNGRNSRWPSLRPQRLLGIWPEAAMIAIFPLNRTRNSWFMTTVLVTLAIRTLLK